MSQNLQYVKGLTRCPIQCGVILAPAEKIVKIESNPATGTYVGGFVNIVSHTETLFEISPRPYGIKVQKSRNARLGEDVIVLHLDNINGLYTGTNLMELRKDLKQAFDIIEFDDIEDDEIDDDFVEEDTDEKDEDTVPPPPSRADSNLGICSCNLCRETK